MFLSYLESPNLGTSLEVWWLRLHASSAEGAGSIPHQGTKTPHVYMPHGVGEKMESLLILHPSGSFLSFPPPTVQFSAQDSKSTNTQVLFEALGWVHERELLPWRTVIYY